MTGYNLIIGVAIIIVIALVWIPINEIMREDGGVVDIMNNMTNATETPDVITYNNMAGEITYYSLFLVIIIVGLYIIKSGIKERGVYAQ